MKTLNTISVLLALAMLLSANLVLANDGQYLSTMQKNIQAVYQAQSVDELQTAVNAFERIGGAEKTKWEPLYYAAFGYIMISNKQTDAAKKDQFLDLAVMAIDKAKALAPAESEIIALEGFVLMMRLSVDPATRGAKYAAQATQSYQKALELNPENPRALGLLAQMQYGAAQFFGSSTTEACGTCRASLEKFETYKSENPLAPMWGKQMSEGLLQGCK
jgi:hypothetical protein